MLERNTPQQAVMLGHRIAEAGRDDGGPTSLPCTTRSRRSSAPRDPNNRTALPRPTHHKLRCRRPVIQSPTLRELLDPMVQSDSPAGTLPRHRRWPVSPAAEQTRERRLLRRLSTKARLPATATTQRPRIGHCCTIGLIRGDKYVQTFFWFVPSDVWESSRLRRRIACPLLINPSERIVVDTIRTPNFLFRNAELVSELKTPLTNDCDRIQPIFKRPHSGTG